MSKGFGKKALLQNKKGSKSTTNSPHKGGNNDKNNNKLNKLNNDSDDKLMVKFVFEGEKFHACRKISTIIYFCRLVTCVVIFMDHCLPSLL